MTDIGSEVDSYGAWYKTDMFFHFISERVLPRKWDETHLPERVQLPRQVRVRVRVRGRVRVRVSPNPDPNPNPNPNLTLTLT